MVAIVTVCGCVCFALVSALSDKQAKDELYNCFEDFIKNVYAKYLRLLVLLANSEHSAKILIH